MDNKELINLIDARLKETLKNSLNENTKTIQKMIDESVSNFKKRNLSFRSKISVDNPTSGFDIANSRTVSGSSFLPISGGTLTGDLRLNANVGFYNTAATSKQTVTGSRGSNAALTSLLTALAAIGLIVDNSS